MLQTLLLNAAVGTTPGSTVGPLPSPFLDGEQATFVWGGSGLTGAGVVKLQGSVDSSTWTDIFVAPASQAFGMANVTCQKYMRAVSSTAFSAGTLSAYLLGTT